ncbi:MAG: hypothetical protein WA956_07105 [Stenotrophomonas sp.]
MSISLRVMRHASRLPVAIAAALILPSPAFARAVAAIAARAGDGIRGDGANGPGERP